MSQFLPEPDFLDVQLPSPNLLRGKILIKNKKLHMGVPQTLSSHRGGAPFQSRHSTVSMDSDGSYNEDYSDDDSDNEVNIICDTEYGNF